MVSGQTNGRSFWLREYDRDIMVLLGLYFAVVNSVQSLIDFE
jgi:hypothetical protein